MSKQILHGDQAREALLSGINQVADSVCATLGPKGRLVLIAQDNGDVISTKDGFTVARSIDLADPFEQMGAQMAKKVTMSTNTTVGDGTTTSCSLVQGLCNASNKHLNSGGSPTSIKRGIDKGLETVLKLIDERAQQITTRKEIERVATISGNDEEVGYIVAESIEKVGTDGIILLEESKDRETTFSVVDGYTYSNGFVSPYLITDASKNTIEYLDPVFLLVDGPLNKFEDLIPFLEKMSKQKNPKPIIIVAETFSQQFIDGLVINKVRGQFRWAATKTPGFGAQKKELIADLACKVNATVFNENLGHKFDTIDESFLGKAKRIVITKDTTTIVEGETNQEAVNDRIELLKNILETEESEYNREKINERLAKLSEGFGIIKIGANSETELKEKKYRYEDALNATRAAISEGILIGGGSFLLKVSEIIEDHTILDDKDSDELIGLKIFKEAIKNPFKRICHNGGYKYDSVSEKVLESGDSVGFDAKYNEICDLFERGIIDPALVTKTALINATSLASLVIMTENLICDIPDKSEKFIMAEPGY